MSDPHATLDHALGLLEAGLSIIPVNTDGPRPKKPHYYGLIGTGYFYEEMRKHPETGVPRMVKIPSWKHFQEKHATAEEVTEWVMRYRVDGFALVTGKISGLVAVDVDLDGLGTLDALGWEPHVHSPSGGAHLYVRHPGFHVKTLKASGIKDDSLRLPVGIDMRGDGGYILLPPTIIKGKGQYVRTGVKRPLRVEDIPEEFQDGERICRLRQVMGLSTAPPPVPPTPQHVPVPLFGMPPALERDFEAEAVLGVRGAYGDRRPPVEPILRRAADRAASGSGRNEAGFWFACQMRDNGYLKHECEMCYPSLVSAFPPCDTKGEFSDYTEREFLDSVRSAYRVAPRDGWKHHPQQHGSFTF